MMLLIPIVSLLVCEHLPDWKSPIVTKTQPTTAGSGNDGITTTPAVLLVFSIILSRANKTIDRAAIPGGGELPAQSVIGWFISSSSYFNIL